MFPIRTGIYIFFHANCPFRKDAVQMRLQIRCQLFRVLEEQISALLQSRRELPGFFCSNLGQAVIRQLDGMKRNIIEQLFLLPLIEAMDMSIAASVICSGSPPCVSSQ